MSDISSADASPQEFEELEVPDAVERLDLGPLPRFPGFVFRRAQARITAGVMRILEPHDLRLTAFSVLMVLKYNPGVAHSAVADTLGVARTNFVALIENLRKRGLVAIHARPDDRRFRALYLSREGLKLVNNIEAQIIAHETKARDELEQNLPGLVGEVFAWLGRSRRAPAEDEIIPPEKSDTP